MSAAARGEAAEQHHTGGELANIPEVMRSYDHWLVWKFEHRDGKLTKMPYIAGGVGRASSTDSRTWRTFEEAVQALETGRYDGIGFVF